MALVVGVVVSLLAAITQIQEMTLTFVPKIVAMALVCVLLGPWTLKVLVAFTADLIARAAQVCPGPP
jgi:flagellar biosynthetic protein FliQ